jgi:uncharacterized membrane protein
MTKVNGKEIGLSPGNFMFWTKTQYFCLFLTPFFVVVSLMTPKYRWTSKMKKKLVYISSSIRSNLLFSTDVWNSQLNWRLFKLSEIPRVIWPDAHAKEVTSSDITENRESNPRCGSGSGN